MWHFHSLQFKSSNISACQKENIWGLFFNRHTCTHRIENRRNSLLFDFSLLIYFFPPVFLFWLIRMLDYWRVSLYIASFLFLMIMAGNWVIFPTKNMSKAWDQTAKHVHAEAWLRRLSLPAPEPWKKHVPSKAFCVWEM